MGVYRIALNREIFFLKLFEPRESSNTMFISFRGRLDLRQQGGGNMQMEISGLQTVERVGVNLYRYKVMKD